MRMLAATAALVSTLILCLPAHGAKHPLPPHHAPAAWVHGSFATCVRIRESGNGTNPNAHGNLYGLQGPHATGSFGDYGWAGRFPRWYQDWLAWRVYQRYGAWAWRPYDGC